MPGFDGFVSNQPHVSIDNFSNVHLGSSIFFLSHLHEDHCKGLGSKGFQYKLESGNSTKFYAHRTTCQLLQFIEKYKHLAKHVVPLEYDVTYKVQVKGGKEDTSSYDMEVVLMNAHHCPGSAMIWLKSSTGQTLYTGDFRLPDESLSLLPGMDLDCLYLDTTFCMAKTEKFPSRTESTDTLIGLIKGWIEQSKENKVYIDFPTTLGYEDLFTSLHSTFGQKFHFPTSDVKLYSGMLDGSLFYTSDCSGNHKLHAGSQRSTKTLLGCGCSLTPQFLIIQISALHFLVKQWLREEWIERQNPQKVRVFYSLHASHHKLKQFLGAVKVRRIIPNTDPLAMPKVEGTAGLKRFLDV